MVHGGICYAGSAGAKQADNFYQNLSRNESCNITVNCELKAQQSLVIRKFMYIFASTCRFAGGGSLARSAKLSDVPRPRMWSWKKTSTSLQKSCGRVDSLSEQLDLDGRAYAVTAAQDSMCHSQARQCNISCVQCYESAPNSRMVHAHPTLTSRDCKPAHSTRQCDRSKTLEHSWSGIRLV